MTSRGWLFVCYGFIGLALVFVLSCAPKIKPIPAIIDVGNQGDVTILTPTLPPPETPKEPVGKWFPDSKRWSSQTIYFAFDDHTIRLQEIDKLHEAVTYAQGHCRIEGHASAEGSDAYNMELGYARAMAVKLFLASADNEAKTEVISFGEENPIALDSENFWKNRRVEVACQ